MKAILAVLTMLVASIVSVATNASVVPREVSTTGATVTVAPEPNDTCTTNVCMVWMGALYQGQWILRDTNNNWQPYSGGAFPVAGQVSLVSGPVVLTVFGGLDISGLKGLELYVGYGVSEIELLNSIGHFALVYTVPLYANAALIIEGTTINSTEPVTWNGVNIPRSVPTTFAYRNNSITSINTSGYMLQAGDEDPGSNNNNLDGEVITGNKFTWNGADMTSITHGVFTGYNINAIIKYNYLDKVPMGIIRKSNGMTNASGGVAYNIVESPNVGIVVKGMSAVKIYNNTLYSARTTSETSRALIDIYDNTDIVPNGAATGTKIFNNIFYAKHQITNIDVYGNENLIGFESDYNVFYCEDGVPMFRIAGVTKTFAQWQALGFDTHSVVINPNFINFTDFIPSARLNYGTNLGTTWQAGLSVNAVWGATDPVTTNQNGTWQVGAKVL